MSTFLSIYTIIDRKTALLSLSACWAAFLPLSKLTKTYGSKRSILVGDAGSQIISSIGAGNTTSAICGKIAAEVLIKFARGDFREMDLSLYEKRWRAELGKMFSLANSLASFL